MVSGSLTTERRDQHQHSFLDRNAATVLEYYSRLKKKQNLWDDWLKNVLTDVAAVLTDSSLFLD